MMKRYLKDLVIGALLAIVFSIGYMIGHYNTPNPTRWVSKVVYLTNGQYTISFNGRSPHYTISDGTNLWITNAPPQ